MNEKVPNAALANPGLIPLYADDAAANTAAGGSCVVGTLYINTTANNRQMRQCVAAGKWAAITSVNLASFATCAAGTDDTTAIQNVLDLTGSAGVTVFGPDNTTCYVNGITMGDNASLIGGKNFKLAHSAATTDVILNVTGANVRLRNIIFDQNGVDANNAPYAYSVVINGASNFSGEDLSIYNSVNPTTPLVITGGHIGGFSVINSSGALVRPTINTYGNHIKVRSAGSLLNPRFKLQDVVSGLRSPPGSQTLSSDANAIYIENQDEGVSLTEVAGASIYKPSDYYNGNGSNGNCVVVYNSDLVDVHDVWCYYPALSGLRANSSNDLHATNLWTIGARENGYFGADLGGEGNLFANIT